MSRPFNLIELAKNLAARIETRATSYPVDLSAEMISGKISEIKSLPKEATIVRVVRSKNGKVYGNTLRVFNVDGIPTVYAPDLQPLQVGVDFIAYQVGGYRGMAIVAVAGQKFQVELALNTSDGPLEATSDEGMPPAGILRGLPSGVRSIQDLKTGVSYQLIEISDDEKTCVIADREGTTDTYTLSKRLLKAYEENGTLPYGFVVEGFETFEIGGREVTTPVIISQDMAASIGDIAGLIAV